ncbi:MAG: glycosyltransferase [Candidatus Helarchaeota archaeon]
MNLTWKGPVFNPTGYSAAARGILKALDEEGVNVHLEEKDTWSPLKLFGDVSIFRKMQQNPFDGRAPRVWHQIPHSMPIDKSKRKEIQMTVFELTRIPKDWVRKCNRMSEVWVPNPFNVEIFSKSGVHKNKLQVIPHGVDVDFFRPDREPLDLKGLKGFNFLSIFQWNWRKGFVYLFKAFLQEFSPGDDVTLILKSYLSDMSPRCQEELKNAIRREMMNNGIRISPRIIFVGGNLSDEEIARLYATADCFVLPSCAEGWGLPYSEAMATGLPTIGTKWSGQTYFMNDENSYLIDIDGLEHVHDYRYEHYHHYMKWSIPSVSHLRKLMRRVYENRKEARRKGDRARKDMISKWTWKHAARRIINTLE